MTATNHELTVVGVFDDRSQAESAMTELRGAGFADHDIGFAMRDTVTPNDIAEADSGTRAGEGAVAGLVTGSVVGGLAAAASLLIPGIGPIIGGGILATVLGGAAAGAATGGLLGGLVGMGVTEEDAQYYNEQFESGRAIVTVHPGERFEEATDILSRHHGYRRETPRDHAFAAHPMSAAIEQTAATAGATAAMASPDANPSVTPAIGTLRPLDAEEATTQLAATAAKPQAPTTVPPAAFAAPALGSAVPRDVPYADTSRDTTREPSMENTPSADDVTEAKRRAATDVTPVTSTKMDADMNVAGKYVEGEETVREARPATRTDRPTASDDRSGGAPDSYRAPDAARGDGPYIEPDEDLERVGATSGLAQGEASHTGKQPPVSSPTPVERPGSSGT